ncbi:tyrosine-type recombinase/integrase [Sorangium sp. So ce117]|uniref:tyrosine-type recombinase/integrase n=1 Tax=Sorangium sp. So ce117 TaxID=3133277 RepID=UPI003F620611
MAATSPAWQYIFPACRPCMDPATGRRVVYHRHELNVQSVVHEDGRETGLTECATCHILRHVFATHLHEARTEIRAFQALLGQKDVRTTMNYAHIIACCPVIVISPFTR